MFDPSILPPLPPSILPLPPLPPMAKQPPVPSILPPLPPMTKQPPLPSSILPPLPPLPPMAKQPPLPPILPPLPSSILPLPPPMAKQPPLPPSILPPLPPMAKQPPLPPSILPPIPPIFPPLPPMAKQPPLPPSILPHIPPMAKQPSLPPMAKQQPPWVPIGTKDCSQGFCSIYCPQWCYVLFPPPPPFFEDATAAADNSSGSPTFSPLVIAVIGILACVFLLISYYTIISKFCGGGRRHCNFLRRRQQHHLRRHDDDGLDEDAGTRSRRHDEEWHWHVPPAAGLDEAFIGKITVCRYKRGDGLVGCSDCSVCLGEFREDESLRLLPKCSHAFHVRCIDTWLKSHSNCPLCRANILLVAPADLPQPPAPPPPPPEANQPEGVRNDEMAVVTGGFVGGTSMENGSDNSSKEFDMIDIGEDESQRMRRSFSMDSFHRGRVSGADILRGHSTEYGEVLVVGSSPSRRSRGEHSLHCDSPAVAVKRTLSSGRFCLTRQGRGWGRGRGRNSVLPI